MRNDYEMTWEVMCNECNKPLKVEKIEHSSYRERVTINIIPCETCLSAKYNEGFGEGQEEATTD